ncbi:hypothetical protein V7S43_000722 [Phytophthora oleae]|uniref:Uncharacterized protein n=1 Tax=Phytophthora oleae TaxID=2107226 RepID=A0ABD3GC93_9STRA
MGDRVMMEEVLELLAAGSPDWASAESATVSSASGSNHTSMVSEFNHGESGDDIKVLVPSGVQGAADPRKDDSLEEKYPADYRTVQFQGEVRADEALQQNSMYAAPCL